MCSCFPAEIAAKDENGRCAAAGTPWGSRLLAALFAGVPSKGKCSICMEDDTFFRIPAYYVEGGLCDLIPVTSPLARIK